MNIDEKPSHITKVGGNVFADLGFHVEEANALQAASRHIIAVKLATGTQAAMPDSEPDYLF